MGTLERALKAMHDARASGASAMEAWKVAIDNAFDMHAALEDCRRVNAARISHLTNELRSMREQRDAAHRLLTHQGRIIGQLVLALTDIQKNYRAEDLRRIPIETAIAEAFRGPGR